MKIFYLTILLTMIILLTASCGLDGFFAPEDDTGNSNRPPEDRRRPADPDPNIEQPPASVELFLPLLTGAEWKYAVEYTQNSKQAEYTVSYQGEERWVNTLIRFSDSTFVFQTYFNGEKIVYSNKETKTFAESSTATITAQIQQGVLVLLQETGNHISPFLGDWLFLSQKQFRVCFATDVSPQQPAIAATGLSGAYTIDKTKGLVNGALTAATAYDETTLKYQLK